MVEVAVVLIVVGTIAGGGALVVMEVMFRRSEAGKRWRQLVDLEGRVDDVVRGITSQIDDSKKQLRDVADTYENAYIRRIIRRRPIRDLKPYLSVSMSWSALERAGITNLEKFMAFRGNFEQIRGIGESRGQGLRSARRKLSAELADSTLPMPTIRPPGTLEFDVVAAAIQAAELVYRIEPDCRELQRQLDDHRDRRRSAVGVRWQFIFGDAMVLERNLEDCIEALQPVQQQASAVAEDAQELGGAFGGFDALRSAYQESEDQVKSLLDSATRRGVRGSLRAVGAAAMRAAEGFDDEEDFCDRGLEPLIEELGYDFRREHTINRRIGSSDKTLYVDFLLLDRSGKKVAVLEAKRNIRTDNQLDDASQQGLSYALFEQVTPVLVAAPQGLWVYRRSGQQLEFQQEYEIEEAYQRAGQLRRQIDDLAGRATSPNRTTAKHTSHREGR